MKAAIQLFTVRDDYKNPSELKKVLRKIKEMGYEGVEFAGFGGLSADEMKAALDELSLVPVSAHFGSDDISIKADENFSYLQKIGCHFAILAYADTSTVENTEKVCSLLKDAAKKAAEYEITLGYHNHYHEFRTLSDGSMPIEHISKASHLEPDTYWVHYSGNDPMKFLNDNEDNIILVHLKDGDGSGHPCALGEGENTIPEIVRTAEKIGMEWIIVENDDPVPNGIEDAERSIKYLKGCM